MHPVDRPWAKARYSTCLAGEEEQEQLAYARRKQTSSPYVPAQ